MNLQELTLLNIGLIVEGKRSPMEYSHEYFPPPYDRAIKLLKENPDVLKGNKDRADQILSSVMLLDEIETAHQVAVRQNGLGEEGAFDFQGSLRVAYDRWSASQKLKTVAKKLENNEEVDLLPTFGMMSAMVTGGRTGLISANSIDYKTYKPYMKAGIPYIDGIIGGWPTDGPIIVVGMQGIGKSYFLFYSICSWLVTHPEKTAAIYTLEMPAEHYIWRSLKMYPEFTALIESGRLKVSGSVRNVDEMVAEVSSARVGFVGIDDMDGLVQGATPEKYQMAYLRIKEICRFMGIPVMVLAQPNRESKKVSEFLGLYSASWSSAAENSAAMFLSLNRVDPKDPSWTDQRFPIYRDNPTNTPRLFLCFWKFREERDEGSQKGIGAIRLEPGITGLYSQIWKGSAYGNKLWNPNYDNTPSAGNRSTQKLNRGDE